MLVVAGCGSSDDSNSSSSTSSSSASTATSTPAAKKIKVGLVTDIGGLNDRSFNSLANQGLESAESTLGIQGRVLTSKSNADYIPNLSTLAQQKYDLVIGVGFLMADAVDTVAKKFPNTKFAIIDNDATGMKNNTNIEDDERNVLQRVLETGALPAKYRLTGQEVSNSVGLDQ